MRVDSSYQPSANPAGAQASAQAAATAQRQDAASLYRQALGADDYRAVGSSTEHVKPGWLAEIHHAAKVAASRGARPADEVANDPVEKKEKKGFFKKLGGFFKKVGKVLGKIAPIALGIMAMIPIPPINVIGMVGTAAIAIYKAVKHKDYLGAVIAIAGAFTGGAAAGVLGAAATKVAQVASQVAQYAKAAKGVIDVVQHVKDGNWLGAIGALGSVVAGAKFGEGAEWVSEKAGQVAEWAEKAEAAAYAYKAAKSGDYLTAIGVGASLSSDLAAEGSTAQQVLGGVAEGSAYLSAARQSLRQGDYFAAASSFSQALGLVADEDARRELEQVKNTLDKLAVAEKAIDNQQYGIAAGALADAASTYTDNEDTRRLLLNASTTFELASGLAEKAREGDVTGAVTQAASLATDNSSRAFFQQLMHWMQGLNTPEPAGA